MTGIGFELLAELSIRRGIFPVWVCLFSIYLLTCLGRSLKKKEKRGMNYGLPLGLNARNHGCFCSSVSRSIRDVVHCNP